MNNFRYLLPLVCLLLLFSTNALAATDITPDLLTRIDRRTPDEMIPVIIEMRDQVALPAVVKNLIQKRPQLIRLLQRRADISQRLLRTRPPL